MELLECLTQAQAVWLSGRLPSPWLQQAIQQAEQPGASTWICGPQGTEFALFAQLCTRLAHPAVPGQQAHRPQQLHFLTATAPQAGACWIPPLRERKDDLVVWARFAADCLNKQLEESALNYLQRQDWPGNTQELLAHVAACAHRSTQPLLQLADVVA